MISLGPDVPVDIDLSTSYQKQNYAAVQGYEDFFVLLRNLENLDTFEYGWTKGDFILWEKKNDFVKHLINEAQEIDPSGDFNSVTITDNAHNLFNITKTYYSLSYTFDQHGAVLSADFTRAHPEHGVRVDDFLELISQIVKWKRPQHLQFGSSNYAMHLHPLSRRRLGIRWIGWLPFKLKSSDVPEAEVVEPLRGGTLVMSQKDYWSPIRQHPAYSKEAIERAQEVEIRLNLLGVLPTGDDLATGKWGA